MVDSAVRRKAGILLHVTSLPSGRIDDDCLRWLDVMAASGLSVWQVLPLVIPDPFGSPYQSPSAFAVNPGLLPLDDAPVTSSALDEYRAKHAAWIEDFALFEVLKRRFGDRSWVEWPDRYRHRDEAALAALRMQAHTEIHTIVEQQYRVDRAWRRVREHARGLGISLFGDIPIFIAHDSADTWANPQDFLLNDEGCPTHVAGVPPDYFAALGQRWGNPHYRWDRMQADGFSWWIGRMARQFALYDLVRIDHFRGLVAVWMIAAESEAAVDGFWQATPGDALLDTLRQHFPDLPIVAEDLGVITDEVRQLKNKYGLPGMSVLQFAFDHFADNPHKPANITHDCIAYTGTHDNDTCVGWFGSLDARQRAFVFEVLQAQPTPDIARLMIRTAMQSRARLAIAPLQDYLALDSSARMNRPGVADGNWQWQFAWDMLPPTFSAEIREMVEASGRQDVK
ncbi:MAG: 4-alpha-glucanotransferase [Chromatiaceae bacterium]|nr:4-alpha-glucanotransferase [Chromatiaceae bacterium]MCP5306622.1 4-alpha-glucanotransferase [Chromatiaceae bacterium]MCP5421877.1 4-alpha-glucanotransferase [Chromatiaceae bacterium]